MSESWHNLHHAYPSSARHGVRGQADTSAMILGTFESAVGDQGALYMAERLAAGRST